jgi:hypothetical protein
MDINDLAATDALDTRFMENLRGALADARKETEFAGGTLKADVIQRLHGLAQEDRFKLVIKNEGRRRGVERFLDSFQEQERRRGATWDTDFSTKVDDVIKSLAERGELDGDDWSTKLETGLGGVLENMKQDDGLRSMESGDRQV